MMIKYCVEIYWSNSDDRFIAEAPELPGCISDGKSYDEALDNLRQIMEEWLETAQMLGREIPIPKGSLASELRSPRDIKDPNIALHSVRGERSVNYNEQNA